MFWFSPCSGVLDNFPSCSNWHCGVNKYGFVLNLVHSTTRFFFNYMRNLLGIKLSSGRLKAREILGSV